MESYDAQGRSEWTFSTAFFVAPNLLLTAGHAVVPPKGSVKTHYCLFPPGTASVEFYDMIDETLDAIDAIILENTFKTGEMAKDIALLSSGSYKNRHYLLMSFDPLATGDMVDIVGYPADKSKMWIAKKHPDLSNRRDAERIGEELLPRGKLAVTRGIVTSTCDDATSYTISTCPGLSGSCVLHNGKIYG